jgi:putative Holliday junction resolvase
MRFLGIDYGEKRVGLAVSDPDLKMAFPLTVLLNSNDLIRDITELCRENEVSEIVLGDSRDYSGKENQIMEEIKPFAEKLKSTLKLPVHFHPEFMTSIEAERLQGKNKMHDASAAALILKSYLDIKDNFKEDGK